MSWYLVILGLILITLEGVLLHTLGMSAVALNLGLILTVFLALNRTLVQGALVLLCWLFPLEIAAAGRTGFLSLATIIVYFLSCAFKGRFERRWGVVHIAIVAGAALIHQLILALLVLVSTVPNAVSSSIINTIPGSVLLTTLCAGPLGYILLKMDRGLVSKKGDNQLFLNNNL